MSFDLVTRIGWSLPLFFVAFAALWLSKALYQWTEPFGFNDQLTSQDNPAFGTALLGYLLGATIALTGAFPGVAPITIPALGSSALSLALQGILVAVLMRASVWAVGRGVLYRFGVRDEMVRDRNVGAGAVLAGGCIAAGLVLHGALSGNSINPLFALRDVIVFWLTGMVILIGGAWLYIHVVKYDVVKVLEHDNNAAAGFSLGGFLIAVGITINASLAGASSNLGAELLITLMVSAIGLVLLVCSAIIAAHIFLSGSPVAKEIAVDKNPAAGLISGACYVAMAVLLARVIAL
jgi:uncharacterized membrane protein YjfL (UPF0719 family)